MTQMNQNPTLAQFRAKYPQYGDLDDTTLMRGIVSKFPQYTNDFANDLARDRFNQIAGEAKPPDYDQQRGQYVREQASQQLQNLLDAERARPGGLDTTVYANQTKFYNEELPEGYLDKIEKQYAQEYDQLHSPEVRYQQQREQRGQAILQEFRDTQPEADDQQAYEHMHRQLLAEGYNPSFAGSMKPVAGPGQLDPSFERGYLGEAWYGMYRIPTQAFQGGAQLVLGSLAAAEDAITGRRPEQGFGFFDHLDASAGHFGRDLQHSLRASDAAQSFNPGNVSWWVANTAEMVPIVATFAASSAAGMVLTGLAESSSYWDLKESLEARGYSKDEARLRALSGAAAMGVTNAVLERVGFGRIAKAWKQPFRNSVAAWTTKWLGAGASEGGTEALQEISSLAVEYGIDAADPALQDIKQILEAGGTGALMGLLFAGAGSAASRPGRGRDLAAQHQAEQQSEETLQQELALRVGALEEPTPGRDSTAATPRVQEDPNSDPMAPAPQPDAEGVLGTAQQMPGGEHVIAEPIGARPVVESPQSPAAVQQPQVGQRPGEAAPAAPGQAQPARDPMQGIRARQPETPPAAAPESQLVRSDTTPEQGQAMAAELGIQFDGHQERPGQSSLLVFTDPQTGSTFMVPPGVKVGDRLQETRSKFEGQQPVERDEAPGQPAGEISTDQAIQQWQAQKAQPPAPGQYPLRKGRHRVPIARLQTQAVVKMDPDQVDFYAEGEQLSPATVIEMADGTLVVDNGNHRIAAAIARGETEVDVVVKRSEAKGKIPGRKAPEQSNVPLEGGLTALEAEVDAKIRRESDETAERAAREAAAEDDADSPVRRVERKLARDKAGVVADQLPAGEKPDAQGGMIDHIKKRGAQEWRDNPPPEQVDFGIGKGPRWVNRVPVPELVAFYEMLVGKHPKVVKQLLGTTTLGYFDPNDLTLAVNPIMALDSRALAKTVAHEIGHVSDYYPQKAIRDRTNILGRLAAVRKYTDTVFGQHKGEDVAKELVALTRRWRDELPSAVEALANPAMAKHLAYRLSGPELYADFMSVMLNDPALAKQMAPKSFDLFVQGFKNKNVGDPQVLRDYLFIQDMLGGTPEALAKNRTKRVTDWFDKTEEVLKQSIALREESEQSILSSLQQAFVDSGAPAIKAVKSKPGGNTTPVAHALGEFDLVDQEAGLLVHRAERDIAHVLRDAGVHLRTFSEWLMMNRISHGDRAGYINPGGFTKEEAAKQKNALEKDLSKEQKAALDSASQSFYDLTFEVAEKLYQEGAYSKELFDKIKANKGHYAYFAVLDHLVDRADWNVKEQVGTFKPIGDPFVTTMMKVVAMANMYERQRLRNVLLPELQKAGIPLEVKKITRWVRPPKTDIHDEIVHHWINGKAHWVKMPKQYANTMKRADLGALASFTRLLTSSTYRGFHDLYVTMNLGWMTMNVPRDMQATIRGTMAHAWKKKGLAGSLEAIPKTLLEYVKVAPAALRHARGRYDKLAEEMMQNRALANIKMADLMRNKEQGDYDSKWLTEFGEPEKAKPLVAEFLSKSYDGFVTAANFTETWSKMAGYRTLQDMGFQGKELAHIIRNDVGTPNIYQKGLATSLTNGLFMYQKVALNGWRRDLKLATGKDTAAGFWTGWILSNGIARLGMIGAAYGLFGDEVKEYFESIPEYEKVNYIIMPIPWSRNADGVVGYIRLPEDHTARWFGGMMWKMAMAASGEDRQQLERDVKDMFSYTGSQIPGPATSLKIPLNWMKFMAGSNPIDDFTDRHILSRDAHAAGGQAAYGEMMTWTAGQFGMLSDIIKPLVGDHWEPREKSAIETTVEWVPGLNRMVKFSDRGVREGMWEQETAEEARSAAFRLSLEPQDDIRRMLRMRHSLNRLQGGRNPQNLAADDWVRRDILNDYYNTYTEMTKAIRDMELAGQDASHVRSSLGDVTVKFKTLVEDTHR